MTVVKGLYSKTLQYNLSIFVFLFSQYYKHASQQLILTPKAPVRDVLYIDICCIPGVRRLCRTFDLCLTSCPCCSLWKKSHQQEEGEKGFWPNSTQKLKGIPVKLNMVIDTVLEGDYLVYIDNFEKTINIEDHFSC